ncbi:MAG: MmgE/PrpD family protein, partial [Pseudomonadota bacterium]
MTTIEQRTQPSRCFDQVSSFVTRCTLDEMNDDTTEMAALCLLDLIGVAAAGSRLDAGRIARDFAATQMAAGREENGRDGQDRPSHQARLIFDGRPVSLSGAAFAAATQIDNFDAHDGWQPSKGHAGVALFPVLLAVADTQQNLAGREALVSLVVGYEVAYRAALALHATVEDYHTSGAWNGLGAAALAARLRNCPAEVLRQAMGIAEYHGPRSQMMREIANPTMLHDGSGMGALTGLKALLLAEMGFTGAPAATVEFAEAAQYWADLGTVWFTPEQYLKPYPICRWAHASIDAALALRTGDSTSKAVAPEEITSVHIATFSEAAALNNGVPTTSSIAQYSLAWPVAAALAHGRVATETVLESAFGDTA